MPKIAALLEDAETDILAFYAFPADHWRKLRSTNPLERFNKEIGRRTDVVGIFPDDASLIRSAGMLCIEQNDEWLVGRRYLSAESTSTSGEQMRKLIITGMAVAMLAVPSAAMAGTAKDTAYDPQGSTCGSGPAGSVTFDKGVATFNVPDNMAYGIIRVPAVNTAGMKVKDLKTLSFKSKSSVGGGMVYMSVITNEGHKVKYTPFEQTPGFIEPGVGEWFTHSPMSMGVRLGDNPGADPLLTWSQALSEVGNDTIKRVSITAGCSIGSGTVQVDRMQVNNSVIDFK